MTLQQYLPFTVLKLSMASEKVKAKIVATVLTVHGIETLQSYFHLLIQ